MIRYSYGSAKPDVFFMVLTILMSPFLDTQLQNTALNVLGASPAFIPLVGVILFFCLRVISGEIKIHFNIFILMYIVLVFAFGLFIFSQEKTIFLGENLILKGIKQGVLVFLFLFPVITSKYLPYNHLWVKKAIIMAYLLTCIGVLVIDVFGNEMFIHHTVNLQRRPRGFSLESSQLSLSLLSLGSLAIHVAKKKYVRFTFIAFLIILLLFSGSKGGIVIGGYVVGLVSWWRSKTLSRENSSLKLIIQFLLVGILVGGWYIFSSGITQMYSSDLREYTSIATRSTLFITVILVMFRYPLGVGFSGYLPAIVNTIPDAIRYLANNLPIPLNFEEVQGYVWALSDQNITTKVFLGDGVVWFGIPFVYIFIKFAFKIIMGLRETRNWFLLFGAVAVFLALSTYAIGIGVYSVSIFLGYVYQKVEHPSQTLDMN